MKSTERAGLILLATFSFFAVAGYWFFGVHPENLARFPSSAEFYAISFSFFARTQVWLSGIVLISILSLGRHVKWLPSLLAVYILSLTSELLGTTTGFPFGDYKYTGLLGAKWFDHVPYLIPLSWFTMALPSFVLVERALTPRVGKIARWALAAALLTSWDLVLDPAMSYLVPYWLWGQSGSFYGMPLINLAGWFVTGFVLAAALSKFNALQAVEHVSTKTLVIYYAIIYALPAGMLVAAGHVLLVVLVTIGIWGALYLGYILSTRWSKEDGSDDDTSEYDDSEPTHHSPKLDDRLERIADRTGEYFEQHSRSFSFASGLFMPEDRVRVSRLYAFCRMSDDIADEQSVAVSERRDMMKEWAKLVEESFDGVHSGVHWLDDLMADLRSHGLSFRVIRELLDAIESDIEFRPIKAQKDLADYSYGVASTVGIMMSHMFDETDPWIQERAISLGLGMQLTNILRDVGADLELGRVYLPQEWLQRYDVTEADLCAMKEGSPLSEGYIALLRDLEGHASIAYRKAWEAIPLLSWRFGPSVAVAAEVYRGIHRSISRNGYNNLSSRAYTGLLRKSFLLVGALARYSGGKVLVAVQEWSPKSIQNGVRELLQKTRMSWMVPFMVSMIHVANPLTW